MSQQPGGFFQPGHGGPQQGGYPPSQQGGYPPQQGGYPPPQQGSPYPPQSGGFPAPYPQQSGGYPPSGQYPPQQQGGYPPQGFPGAPQQQSGYPPSTGYPGQPSQGGYPPPTSGLSGYPPQSGQPSGYPQAGAGYPGAAPQSGYPPASGPGGPGYPGSAPQSGYPPAGNSGYPGSAPSSGYPAPSSGYPPQSGYPGQQPMAPQSTGGYPAPGGFGSGNMQSASPYGNMDPNKPQAPGSTKIELSVACTNLKDQDSFSKSDPVCVMYVMEQANWIEFGRTEMIQDCHHPRWQKKFLVDYAFERKQDLKFEIYDWDSKSNKLKKHDKLGMVVTTLGSIVSAPGKQFSSALKSGSGGRLTIIAEEMSGSKEVAKIHLAGKKLDKKDTFGKSDPFFIMSKKTPNGQWSVVYRSEVVKNSLDPSWIPIQKPVDEICNGDYDRQLKIEIFDSDGSGETDTIGEFVTNMSSLRVAVQNGTTYEVINLKKQKNKKGYKNSGTVSVRHFSVEQQNSFLDYVQGR